MKPATALAVAAALVLGTAVPLATPAAARTERSVGWTAEQVWPAAVRFLRVDEDVAIVDKDAESGYVVFEYRDEGKTFRGALEVVRVERDGAPRVLLILTIADRPDYLEAGMLERLERKLQAELGSPPAPPRKEGGGGKPGKGKTAGEKPRDEKPRDEKPRDPDSADGGKAP